MTDRDPTLSQPDLPATRDEKAVSREIPFSLIWLHALDPRIFTPTTWANGRTTRIRLLSPDQTVDVSVSRVIARYRDGNIGLQDEIHSHHENAGSQFSYEFGPEPEHELIKYNPKPSMSDHMEGIVRSLSTLVNIPGASIEATNKDSGPESYFVSDGAQWIDVRTGQPAITLTEITVGQSSVESPGSA